MTNINIVKFKPLEIKQPIVGTEDHSKLQWGMRMGYPRMTVYTKSTGDNGGEFDYNTLIIAPFDCVMALNFIGKMRDVIYSDSPKRQKIDCINYRYVDNVITDELYVQATVVVEKDIVGVVSLTAVAEGKDTIPHVIKPNPGFFNEYDDGGEIITDPGLLSSNYAKSYVELLKELIIKHSVN